MDRRTALRRIAALGAAPVVLQACGKKTEAPARAAGETQEKKTQGNATPAGAGRRAAGIAVPETRPESWDPVAFNRDRGAKGAIPSGYMAKINAPDGVAKHLGKHLPYVVTIAGVGVDQGTIGLMWGDARKGWVRHPNAATSERNPKGHWYDWIRVRNSRTGRDKETRFDGWPRCSDEVNGKIAAQQGEDPTSDGGRNSVYVTALPEGTVAGDELRVWGHCLTHGEYVDFLRA